MQAQRVSKPVKLCLKKLSSLFKFVPFTLFGILVHWPTML